MVSVRHLLAVCVLVMVSGSVLAQEPEPIAYFGHGGFFDQSGKQIEVTPQFVARAQAWYRNKLLAALPAEKKAQFTKFESQLFAGFRVSGQTQLVLQQRSLDWLLANSVLNDRDQTSGKLNALKRALQLKLDEGNGTKEMKRREPFTLAPEIEKRLKTMIVGAPIVFLSTINKGQAYLNECTAAGVPIPPPIGVLDPNGTAGWKSQGFIPQGDQFIVGSPAELRSFTSPSGMCFALPRYSDNSFATVDLDGVICLSKTTSKVCFWDNQMSGNGFSFASGTKIPIGVPDLAINPAGQYQAGGFELNNGSGGPCTNCHAGENPYIIHPKTNLGSQLWGTLKGPPQNLPTFGPNRYDPLVPAAWWQNGSSHSAALVPAQCGACHVQGDAGRFPHLSTDTGDYCATILQQAIDRTMPPSAPGSLKNDAAILAFKAWCNSAPTSGPSDRGDPHLTTTNGIHYDFQSGGEFTALRNSDTRFELQTRQTPVSTTFMPGPNSYTGLASCVSLNTAAALHLGKHRVSYQPGVAGGSRMELRIDGSVVSVPPQGINLGDGDWIGNAGQEGGLDVHAADGTHVIITPQFWTSQGYWYLNVEVLNTPAREGTMGNIASSDWLPVAPNGTSFGPAPVSLSDRHILLNQKFANAWRVTKISSLFDYALGTSTLDFTFPTWPPEPGGPCVVPGHAPVQPMPRERAQQLCAVVTDKAANENCIFDVAATGEAGFATAYVRSLQLRDKAGTFAPTDLCGPLLPPSPIR